MPLRLKLFAFSVLLLPLFMSSCSDDEDNPVPPSNTVDYFPFAKGYVWTYETNVFKDWIGPSVMMDLKIDTATNSRGHFTWMLLRIPDKSPDWTATIGVFDSAGTIYSIGDHPIEGYYPLFKHEYEENEIERETITVKGRTYETVKIAVQVESIGSVTWWFADGVGLVREHSMQGLSLFSDDNDDEVLTELVSYTR
ncbi:MAG: hypothetical protein JXA28_02210 [Bacteroidetes bacterium]|nr:hypothetical protein [Bacteroidota bacterium]